MNFARTLALAALLSLGAPALAAPTPVAGSPGPTLLPSAFEDPYDVPLPDKDLWQRIRLGFALEPLESHLVAEHEKWYASRPEYIKRFVDRGSLYLHHIVEQVEKRKMPMEIALLPVIESAFVPKANSKAKASGLWQFIPSTGKNYGLSQDWWRDNRRDVVAATDAALNYLQRLHDMFGSWELALAAYNCGEGCVARAIGYNQKRGLPVTYLDLKLPPETVNYVPKLIAVKNIVLSPPSYGIDLESVPDEPYFTTVQAPSKIDVKVAARLAGMSEEEFVALNPAHNKPVAVATSGTLIVPMDKADQFRTNLENYDKPLVSWTTYSAKRGEALEAIAKRHNASLAQIKSANDGVKLDKKGRLRAAGPVLVPMATQVAAKPAAQAASKTAVPAAKPVIQVAQAAPARETASDVVRTAPVLRLYTVRAGDTLYGIARKFGTAVDALLAVNKLNADAVLHPGLRLRLP
jgi:membrane-bound lytic murein transglycosylase D